MKHSVSSSAWAGSGRGGPRTDALGHEVLAMDSNEGGSTRSRRRSPRPCSSMPPTCEAFNRIGAGEFDHAIVAISGQGDPAVRDHGLQSLGVANVVVQGRARCSTARSSSGWAQTGSSSRSGRWAGGWRIVRRPERDRLRRRRARLRPVVSRVPPTSWHGGPLARSIWAHRFSLSSIVLRRGDEITIDPDANNHRARSS